MALLYAVTALHALTIQLAAQQASYRFPPDDTLRYREITEGQIRMRPPLPPGAVTLKTLHDAKVALATEGGDTVTAWYDELTLSVAGPEGNKQPPTNGALGLPFRLVVTPAGHVTTLSAPAFPTEIAILVDLSRQFEEFFISLPPSALVPRATWADTVENSTSGGFVYKYHTRHVRRYRALRDTILPGGLAGVVIALEQQITVRSSRRAPNAPVTVHTRLQGRETGTAVFAPAAARLISRARRGQLEGEQVLSAEGRAITVPMSYQYSSRLAAIP